jgi:hypothetical protein
MQLMEMEATHERSLVNSAFEIFCCDLKHQFVNTFTSMGSADSCDCTVVAIDQDPVAYDRAKEVAALEQYR